MIDPDYIPTRVPYASPLPQALKPRLPGKPVQNMPPRPQRQGRRGYDSARPKVTWQNMIVPAVVTGVSFFVLMFCLSVVTWGMGVFLAPFVAPFFAAWGVYWAGKAGRESTGQANRFALGMTTIFGAIPLIFVASKPVSEMWMAFTGLFIVTALFAAMGAYVASLETWKPRTQPCVEL